MKEKISTEEKDNKFTTRLSLFFSALGLLSILLNWHGIPSAGIVSFPCGIAALLLAIASKRAVLIILSIFVIPSFYISQVVALRIDASTSIWYDSPDFVYSVRHEGYIYDIIRESEGGQYHLYFAKENCLECDIFSTALENVLDEEFPTIFYYDVEAMPREEVEDVMSRLDIDRVPYLIKLEKGNVVDSVAVADEGRLKQFFEN